MTDDPNIHQQLGRIEGKLDTIVTTLSRAHARIDALEKDLVTVKTSQAKYAAYVSVGAIGASGVMTWIMSHVSLGG